jgi:hypothetical protein
MKTTIGAIALIGIVLVAPVAVSLIVVTASQTGSASVNVDPQDQSRNEHSRNSWTDEEHDDRFRPRGED